MERFLRYPTSTNSSINVGDYYAYQSGVRLSPVGGAYGNDTKSGPLAFDVYEALTYSHAAVGSSACQTFFQLYTIDMKGGW